MPVFHTKLLGPELCWAPWTSFLALPHLQPGEKWSVSKVNGLGGPLPLWLSWQCSSPPHHDPPSVSLAELSQNAGSSFPRVFLLCPLSLPAPCSSSPGAEPLGLLLAWGQFAQEARSPSFWRGLRCQGSLRATAWGRSGQSRGCLAWVTGYSLPLIQGSCGQTALSCLSSGDKCGLFHLRQQILFHLCSSRSVETSCTPSLLNGPEVLYHTLGLSGDSEDAARCRRCHRCCEPRCCMLGCWCSTSIHLSIAAVSGGGQQHPSKAGAEPSTSSLLCDLSLWCEAPEPQCPCPTRPQGQQEGVQSSEALGALPHGCLPGPRSPPEAGCFPLHCFLNARPAPFSVVGLWDLSGGQKLGNAPGREGAQTSLRTGMPFIPS